MPKLNEEVSLLDIHDSINELKSDFKHHQEKEEDFVVVVKEGIKELKIHVTNIEEKFDKKLVMCRADVNEMIADNHYTKHESQEEITKATNALEKRMLGKVKLVGWVIAGFSAALAFLSKYGAVILHLMGGKNS